MDFEAEVQRLKEQLKLARADNAALTKHLDHGLRTRDARDAIASAGGNVNLLLPLAMARTRTAKDGDNFVVEVVGDDGYTRIKDATTNMSVADLVAEMREHFPRAFTPPAHRANPAHGDVVAPDRFEGTIAEKTAFIKRQIGMQGEAPFHSKRVASSAPAAPSAKPLDEMTMQEKVRHMQALIEGSEA